MDDGLDILPHFEWKLTMRGLVGGQRCLWVPADKDYEMKRAYDTAVVSMAEAFGHGWMMVVAFSARIPGEGLTIHSSLALFFLKLRLARAH